MVVGLAGGASAGTVAVFGDELSGFSKSTINDFYNGLGGHTSSLISSLSASTLAGVDLLWATQPSDLYTADELNAMQSYIGGGGRIAFMGEHGTFAPSENTRINTALSFLGSTMSIINEIVDGGGRTASRTDGQILDDPLLAGVDTYGYAAFAPLVMGSNGKALMIGEEDPTDIMMGFENIGKGSIFLITDQNVWDSSRLSAADNGVLFENLIAGDTSNPENPVGGVVPLPAAGWMLIAGLGGLVAMRRRART